MGHTHDPDQFQIDGKWFYNTGTWIPILGTSSAELRRDRMFFAGRSEPWPIVVKQ